MKNRTQSNSNQNKELAKKRAETKRYEEVQNNKTYRMPDSEPIEIETPLKLALRLITNIDPKVKMTWETVEKLVTWKDMKGYNVRIALAAGANKKHLDALYKKAMAIQRQGCSDCRACQMKG